MKKDTLITAEQLVSFFSDVPKDATLVLNLPENQKQLNNPNYIQYKKLLCPNGEIRSEVVLGFAKHNFTSKEEDIDLPF